MATLQELGQNAVAMKPVLQKMSTEEKNRGLCVAADALVSRAEEILTANEKDMENARANGMSAGLLDRLKLTTERIGAMAEGLQQISELPDFIS